MSEPVILLPSHQMNFQFTVKLARTNRTLTRNFPKGKVKPCSQRKTRVKQKRCKNPTSKSVCPLMLAKEYHKTEYL